MRAPSSSRERRCSSRRMAGSSFRPTSSSVRGTPWSASAKLAYLKPPWPSVMVSTSQAPPMRAPVR